MTEKEVKLTESQIKTLEELIVNEIGHLTYIIQSSTQTSTDTRRYYSDDERVGAYGKRNHLKRILDRLKE